MQARGATCVAFPAVERGERFGGWLQASILGFSQSCEERDSLGSKARCDRGGHPSRRTVLSEQAPPVYRSVVYQQKKKKAHRVKQNVREMLAALIRRENRGPIERYTR